MSANMRNPLKLSVAHKVHGRQMRTGWPECPKFLADRQEKDNNILIETWFSNVVKFDYPEVFHDDLRKMVRSINIPRELYNPHAPRPTVHTVDHPWLKDDSVDLFDISEFIGGVGHIDDNNEEMLKAINGEDGDEEDKTEHQDKPEQSKAVPAAMSFNDIKRRYQAVRSKISALDLYPHLDVYKIGYGLLDTVFGDKPIDDQISQLDEQLSTLEGYVNAADAQMTEVGEGGIQESDGELEASPPAAPIDTRFNIFRDIALGLCTTPQLANHVPLVDFLEMINSNIMEDREFDEGEAGAILARMSQLREIRWDKNRRTVRGP
jgi:hypothetical protein